MICVSIGTVEFERCLAIAQESQMAEIRLDKNCYSERQLRQLFSMPVPLIATFRGGSVLEPSRKILLETAISAGAAYVDMDAEDSDELYRSIRKVALAHRCKVILSYHNHSSTPARRMLQQIIARCVDRGADIVKIACLVHDSRDAARLLALYDSPRGAAAEIIAIGMGEKGVITRIAATLLGAPFTYACVEGGEPTAPGQLSGRALEKVYRLIYS